MNCAICRGACCETIVIPLSADADTNRWVLLHGISQGGILSSVKVSLNCRCTALTVEGACSIYEDRPDLCRIYPAGGPACLDVVRVRRTAEEYEAIRDEGDPERIH